MPETLPWFVRQPNLAPKPWFLLSRPFRHLPVACMPRMHSVTLSHPACFSSRRQQAVASGRIPVGIGFIVQTALLSLQGQGGQSLVSNKFWKAA
jgi:hypothetical protein